MSHEAFRESDATIYFEDCIVGMEKLAKESVDLIIADPPFGIDFDGRPNNYNRDRNNVIPGYNEVHSHEYSIFSTMWLAEAKRVLKKYGVMYVFSSWNRLWNVKQAAFHLGLYLHSQLVSIRTFPVYKRWNWVDSVYHILMLLKYKAPRTGKPSHTFNKILTPNSKTGKLRHYPRCDLQFQETYLRGKKKNGTKLPNELVRHLILTSSNIGDLILDPFLGNGTTAVESLRTNRRVIGFEINQHAMELIKDAIRGIYLLPTICYECGAEAEWIEDSDHGGYYFCKQCDLVMEGS